MSQFNVFKNASSPDQIYFDITTTNFQSTTAPPPTFYYNESRELPFVDKPDDYYLSIMRFTCETGTLPVFIPSIAPASTNRFLDPNLTIYSVTLQYVDRTDPASPVYGDLINVPIVWKPQDQSITPPTPVTVPAIVYPTGNTAAAVAAAAEQNAANKSAANAAFTASIVAATAAGYYNCYSFSHLTNLVQEALNTAFSMIQGVLAFKDTPVTNPAATAPIFAWDTHTSCAYFVVPATGYQETNSFAEYVYSSDVSNDPNATIFQRTATALPTANSQAVNGKLSVQGLAKAIKSWSKSSSSSLKSDNIRDCIAVSIGDENISQVVGGPSGNGTYNPQTILPGDTVYKDNSWWVYVSPNVWYSTFQSAFQVTSGVPGNPYGVPQVSTVGLSPGIAILANGQNGTHNTGLYWVYAGNNSWYYPSDQVFNAGGFLVPTPQVPPPPVKRDKVVIAPGPVVMPPLKIALTPGTAKLEVYMNAPLYQLFNSFPAVTNGYNSQLASNGRNYRLLFLNQQGINVQTYTQGASSFQGIRIDQEYSTIFNMSPITSLVFCSNTLPVQPNLVSNPLILDNNQQVSRTGMNAATANIITDLTANDGNYRPYLVYLPSAQYRYTTLYGNQPLYNLDLSIFYRTKMGQLIPFQLASGSTVTIKLAFIKKASVTPGIKL